MGEMRALNRGVQLCFPAPIRQIARRHLKSEFGSKLPPPKLFEFYIPLDTESYVHRIGRTGRAGRTGEAILFVTPREKRLLSAIERATRQKIQAMEPPTA